MSERIGRLLDVIAGDNEKAKKKREQIEGEEATRRSEAYAALRDQVVPKWSEIAVQIQEKGHEAEVVFEEGATATPSVVLTVAITVNTTIHKATLGVLWMASVEQLRYICKTPGRNELFRGELLPQNATVEWAEEQVVRLFDDLIPKK